MSNRKLKANPYDWINPVENKGLFAGRSKEIADIMDELLRLKHDHRARPTVAIIGERRIGKTSLLLRVKELCQEQSLPAAVISVDDRMAADAWEFWKEIYYGLLTLTHSMGIKITSNRSRPMGFIIPPEEVAGPPTP